jgi:nicotinamide-nucleotide amidase
MGGLMTYANEAKRDLCGVPEALIAEHGAVSAPVAAALARGARERLRADWAASITGVAGPNGGSDAKPVGTVYIGVSGPDFESVRRFRYPGERAIVRDRAAKTALVLLRRKRPRSAQAPWACLQPRRSAPPLQLLR